MFSVIILVMLSVGLLVLLVDSYYSNKRLQRTWNNRYNIIKSEYDKIKNRDLSVRIEVDTHLCEMGKFSISGTSESRLAAYLLKQLEVETKYLLPGKYMLQVTYKKMSVDHSITKVEEILYCTNPDSMFNVLRSFSNYLFLDAVALHLEVVIFNMSHSIEIPAIQIRSDLLDVPFHIEVFPCRAKPWIYDIKPPHAIDKTFR